MRMFDIRFKRKVVQEYRTGKGGYKILAATYDIADSLVRGWVAAHQHHGSAGLVHQRGRYPYEFKLEVLHRLAADNLSYRELAAIYNIGHPPSITMWQQQHERGALRSLQRIPPFVRYANAAQVLGTWVLRICVRCRAQAVKWCGV